MSVSAFPYGVVAAISTLNTAGFRLEDNSVNYNLGGVGGQAGYRFASSGISREDRNTVETDIGDWHVDAPSPPSGVEIRLTVLSGSDPTSGPAIDTWIDLTSPFSGSREWLYTGPPAISGSWLIEIRDSSSIVRASAQFNVTLTNT
jgi:hypothetical protein